MPLFTSSVTGFLEEFDQALEWLRNMGLRIEKNCRFLIYRANLDRFIKIVIRKTESAIDVEIAEIRKSLANSYLEAEELIYIFRAFRDSLPPASKRKMGEILGGPSHYDSEDINSNHARNTAFELYVAAKMKNAGYSPFPTPDADVLFEAEDYPFLVECKRPLRWESVDTNIRKANKQLKTRFDNSADKKGLITLSLTRLANPRLEVLPYADQQSMFHHMDSLWTRFKERYGEVLRNRVHKRILGWLVVIRVPVSINNVTSDISLYNQSYFVNITAGNEPEHEAMQRIIQNVENSYPGESRPYTRGQ